MRFCLSFGIMKLHVVVLVLVIYAARCEISVSDDEGGIIVSRDENGNIHTKEVPPNPWQNFYKKEDEDCLRDEVQRSKRQAKKEDDPNCLKRWPNGYIPYRYDLTENPIISKYVELIEVAIAKWRNLTCLVLEDISDDSTKWNQPHLILQSEKIGCSAVIGRDCNSNGQRVNIDSGCGNNGLIMHELAHAFGLYHQHVRADRDDYITVVTDNIMDEKIKDFDKKETDMFDIPYDYTSLLHYGKMTHSKNCKPTILTKDPMMQYVIGNPPEPSHYDVMIVNAMYTCSATCSDLPVCKNGGFVDKNCKCKCPHNTKGDLCETVTGEYYKKIFHSCGDQIIETDAVIKSFDYPNPKPKEPKEIRCQFYLKAPPGKKAQITFDEFDLYPHAKCKSDYLDIMLDLYTVDQRACGTTLKGKTITATNRSIMILWHGRSPQWPTGFQATVTFIEDDPPPTTLRTTRRRNALRSRSKK